VATKKALEESSGRPPTAAASIAPNELPALTAEEAIGLALARIQYVDHQMKFGSALRTKYLVGISVIFARVLV
jgi:hypothetical protein